MCHFQGKPSQPKCDSSHFSPIAVVMVGANLKSKPPSAWIWVTMMSRVPLPTDIEHVAWIGNKDILCYATESFEVFVIAAYPDLTLLVPEYREGLAASENQPLGTQSNGSTMQELAWPLSNKGCKPVQQPQFDQKKQQTVTGATAASCRNM